MLRYFFTYGDDLPPGCGFTLFGPAHFAWLAVCAAGIVLFLARYRKWDGPKRRRAEKRIGVVLVCLITCRTLFPLFSGRMTVYELPLHLCSMAGYLCCLHAFLKWDWLSQALYTLCLPGTLFALFFPDWVRYPTVHFVTVVAFLFHAGIVLYVACQLMGRGIVPQFRKLWKAVLFLLVTVPLIFLFDKEFDANYMFLNWPSPGSPLEWMASFLGNPGYLLGYAILAAAVILFMDAAYALIGRILKARRGAGGA